MFCHQGCGSLMKANDSLHGPLFGQLIVQESILGPLCLCCAPNMICTCLLLCSLQCWAWPALSGGLCQRRNVSGDSADAVSVHANASWIFVFTVFCIQLLKPMFTRYWTFSTLCYFRFLRPRWVRPGPELPAAAHHLHRRRGHHSSSQRNHTQTRGILAASGRVFNDRGESFLTRYSCAFADVLLRPHRGGVYVH